MIRRRFATFVLACIMGAAPMYSAADDTDIYIDPNLPNADQPMVMFTLDYRPNLMGTAAAAGTEAFFTGAPYNLDTDIATLKSINPDGQLNYFDQLFLSLVAVLQGVSDVKVGLLMAHNVDGNVTGYQGESPTNKNNRVSNGGVILYGFNSLDAANKATTLAALKAKLIAVKRQNTGSSAADHTYQGAEMFFEFFRYLTGQKVYSGHNGWGDYESGNDDQDNTDNMRCTHTSVQNRPACWDPNIEDADPATEALDAVSLTNPANTPPSYVSPFKTAGSCAKVFTINFLFQVSQQDNAANNSTDAGAGTAAGGLGFTPSNSTALNDVLAFLRNTDLAENPELDVDTIGEAFGPAGSQPELAGLQNVTSFFVSNNSNTTTNGYAAAGGTEAVVVLGDDPQGMIDKLTNIFSQILSVSTTFVAASVPVNVFNRAEIVDNVYFALFQAEGGARWKGNLKKLKLASENVVDTNNVVVGKRFRIVDSLNQDAIGSADGRIVPNAKTFWTDNSPGNNNSSGYLQVGDSNGDGIVDARDNNDADTFANNVDPETGQVTFPTPAVGTGTNATVPANPKDYVTKRDGRHIPRGGAGQKAPGFRSADGTTPGTPGDSNPTAGSPAGSDAPPEAGPRKVFYLSGGTLTPLNVYGAGSTEIEELKVQLGLAAGATTDLAAQKLLRYARGQDATDFDQDCGTETSPTHICRTESRYWMMGDPLHSRPLPINYGASATTSVPKSLEHESKANPAIFIAMASNDGHLRMFRNTGGTTSDAVTPAELGHEVWSFMPPEGLAVQQRLLDNSQPAGQSPHPYSFDGESTALIIDQNGNGIIECAGSCDGAADDDRVILYVGLRRGGSAYYALDITEPLNPKFLWRITPGGVTTSSGFVSGTETTFAEMGQTFSRPRIGRLSLGVQEVGDTGVFESRTRLAVLFGGGYDGGYTLSGTSTARLGKDRDGVMDNDSKGNAIYAVRANDASLIWKAVRGGGTPTSTVFQHANLKDSIPSNLTLVDSNADGTHDRIYVGDTGGNLWRVDMVNKDLDDATNTDPTQAEITDDWKLTRLACIGRHSASAAAGGCTTAVGRINDRRFFHEPDVVQSSDVDGRFDAVVVGSGDREDPTDQGGDVNNYFYLIKDRNTGIGVTPTGGTITDSTVNHFDLEDVTDIADVCTPDNPGNCDKGWAMHLDNPNGEKALSAPVTIANSIFFTTYLPPGASSNVCGPGEGGGFLYALKLESGEPARDYNPTDGITNPDGSGTTDDDRDKDLETPGIPAQVVYLGTPPGGGGTGGACTVNILAGARILEAPGCPRFRTFWQRVGQ